jgi:hypothetical protein
VVKGFKKRRNKETTEKISRGRRGLVKGIRKKRNNEDDSKIF